MIYREKESRKEERERETKRTKRPTPVYKCWSSHIKLLGIIKRMPFQFLFISWVHVSNRNVLITIQSFPFMVFTLELLIIALFPRYRIICEKHP